MKVSFYLNKETDLGREIMLRVSHKGKPTAFFTGYHVPEKLWDGDKVSGRHSGSSEINRNIQRQKNELERMIRDIEFEKGKEITLEDIRARYKPEKTKGTPSGLIEVVRAFTKAKAKELMPGTLSNYNALLNKHLPEYSDHLGTGIMMTDVDAEWLKDFQVYLNEEKKLTNDTVHKLIVRVKAVLTWANADTNYKEVRTKEIGKEVVFLEWDELMKLWEMSIADGLRPSLDMFLFSCFTGMRHSDVLVFDKSDIRGDFIYLRQIKTTDQAFVPINKYSKEILERNNYEIPKISGAGINSNLKAIGARAGLDSPQKRIRYRGKERIEAIMPKYDLLTFHVGRSTFIMTHLAKGIAAEAVMKMTGHRDYKSFQRYVRFSESLLIRLSKQVYG